MSYSINPELAVKGTIWANRGGGSALEPLDPGADGQALILDHNEPLGVKWGESSQTMASATVDGLVEQATTIFTNGSRPFLITSISAYLESVENYSGAASYSVGFTDPTYDDYLDGVDALVNEPGEFNTEVLGGGVSGPFQILQPGVELKVLINNAAIADVYNVKFLINGFVV